MTNGDEVPTFIDQSALIPDDMEIFYCAEGFCGSSVRHRKLSIALIGMSFPFFELQGIG